MWIVPLLSLLLAGCPVCHGLPPNFEGSDARLVELLTTLSTEFSSGFGAIEVEDVKARLRAMRTGGGEDFSYGPVVFQGHASPEFSFHVYRSKAGTVSMSIYTFADLVLQKQVIAAFEGIEARAARRPR